MASQINKLNALMSAQQLELRRAVHAFNEKIRYHAAKGAQALPQKISLRDVLPRAETAHDYKTETARIRRFGERGAEKSVKLNDAVQINKWEYKELQRGIKNVNAKRAAQKQAIGATPAKSRGVPLGYNKNQMPEDRQTEFNPITRDLKKARSVYELRALAKGVYTQAKKNYFQERNIQMIENYKKTLREQYGPRANAIIAKIESLGVQGAARVMFTDTEGSVTFGSPKNPFDREAKLEAISKVWGVPYQDAEEAEDIEI